MRSLHSRLVLFTLLFAGVALYGCGAADKPTEDTNTTVVVDPTRIAAYVGNWQGGWNVSGGNGNSIGGSSTFTVSQSGRVSGTLENSSGSTFGVFTKDSETGTYRTGTLNGSINNDGYFSGTVTTADGTDSISGPLFFPLSSSKQLRVSLSLVDRLVQYTGPMNLSPQN